MLWSTGRTAWHCCYRSGGKRKCMPAFETRTDSPGDCFSGTHLLFWWSSDVGNLISGSAAFSKTSLNIWKFTVHVLLKPGLENFEHYFASVWDEYSCVEVWAFLALPFFGIGMKTDLFSPVVTAEFSKFAGILSVALSQHHLLGFEIAQLEFHHLH